MPQQLLNRFKVCSVHDQIRCERMQRFFSIIPHLTALFRTALRKQRSRFMVALAQAALLPNLMTLYHGFFKPLGRDPSLVCLFSVHDAAQMKIRTILFSRMKDNGTISFAIPSCFPCERIHGTSPCPPPVHNGIAAIQQSGDAWRDGKRP